MVNNFTTYEWMYYGGIAGGITFFALSVIIFVKYQIHRVIGELSGRTAKKNIRKIEAEYKAKDYTKKTTGEILVKKGETTDQLSASGKLSPAVQRNRHANNGMETELLTEMNETGVLGQGETTLLSGDVHEREGIDFRFIKELEIIVTHSDQQIQ